MSLEAEAARLLLRHRWAALATEGPAASMVAYAPDHDLNLLLYLSSLSPHTRRLEGMPTVALVVSEPDPGTGDPQALARVSITGSARRIERSDPEFSGAWGTYVAHLPEAAARLALTDFSLFRVNVDEARYVGGFARAGTVPVESLRAAAAEIGR
jgi:putative heme iron utilization protein